MTSRMNYNYILHNYILPVINAYCTLIVEARGSLHLAQEGTEYDVVGPVGCGCAGHGPETWILRHTGSGAASAQWHPQHLASYSHTHAHSHPHQQKPATGVQLHRYQVAPLTETYT